jgi:hypothetical protein
VGASVLAEQVRDATGKLSSDRWYPSKRSASFWVGFKMHMIRSRRTVKGGPITRSVCDSMAEAGTHTQAHTMMLIAFEAPMVAWFVENHSRAL